LVGVTKKREEKVQKTTNNEDKKEGKNWFF
jgi:hypothetical protein